MYHDYSRGLLNRCHFSLIYGKIASHVSTLVITHDGGKIQIPMLVCGLEF